MIRRYHAARLLPVSAALCFVLTTAAANAQAPLFQSVGLLARDASRETTIKRSRLVSIDFAQLTRAAADRMNSTTAGDEPSRKLNLNLFGDVSYQVVIDRTERSSDNATDVWIGHIPGMKFGSVFIGVTGTVAVGNIKTGTGELYQIRYTGSGQIHAISDVDESKFPAELPPLVPNVPAGNRGREQAREQVAGDSGSVIDVMVVYTPSARAAAGGTAAMNTLIQVAFSETNQGYLNSQVLQRINLVHSTEVAYSESSTDPFNTAIASLASGTLNAIVLPLRNQYRADLVSLWINSPTSCGLGYVMTNVGPAFEAYGYSVLYFGCATGTYTFAHEMGHNEGAEHDRANSSGMGAYPYSYGYQQINASPPFRTIMAYDCAAGCGRINYWSNPDVSASLGGAAFPTGVIVPSASSADNALTLNNTRLTVANFRQAAAPDLSIGKSHSGDFTLGQTGASYSITVSNVGTGPSSGAVTVTELLPVGLTATSMAGSGWSCVQPAGPCSRSDVLSEGGNFPAITMNANVSNTAARTVTNTASVSGGGETNTSNDTASDPATVLMPVASASPAALGFGNQNVGSTSIAKNTVLTNSGNGVFTIGGIGFQGANAADFSQSNNCGSSLVPGANCTISASFRPSAPGGRSAAMSISGNATGSPAIVALTGSGVAVAVDLTAVTFQTSPAGQFVQVDGIWQMAPFTVRLTTGTHTVFAAPIVGGGVRNTFQSWSDGQAQTHSISVGSAVATFSATFQTAYQLTSAATPAASGIVVPGSGYVNAGTVVPLSVTPSSTFQFANWIGAVANPASSSTSVTMSGPLTVTANLIPTTAFFVRQLYRDLLSREPDPSGFSYWTGTIDSGTLTRSVVASSLFTSPEFSQAGLYVIKLYVGVLGRDPDFGGWLNWFTALRSGTTPTAVLNAFLGSPEFQNTYGGLSNADFVTLVYRNVLGRVPDAGGFANWVGLLNGGQLTRADVMGAFVNGPEFDNLVRSRAYANLCYMGFLRRSADSNGLTYWTGILAGGTPLSSVIYGFVNGPEYLNRLGSLAP